MVEIQKSGNDNRLYKYITLENGFQAILISDPDMQVSVNDTNEEHQCGCDDHICAHKEGENGLNGRDEHMNGEDDSGDDDSENEEDGEGSDFGADTPAKSVKKAGASLVVGVGSFSDPLDIQGLSHYLEHMLFMGSEKYPDENEYDSFLASHGGSSNAYTEMEYTNYHFDVSPAHLQGALDRFAQFFIEPLCKADALEREVQAVNNEFTGVRQNDSARLAQLRSHTCKPNHLYRKLTWGNKKSLIEQPEQAGIDVRRRLIEYYKQEYSAERMALAIVGCNPLETLEEWVRNLFSSIPNGAGPKTSFEGISKPYEAAQFYLLPSVKEAHNLSITFTLPSLNKRYLAKADEYLSSLIGHEGQGSLLSLLKENGWASGLAAGVTDSGYERNSGLYLFDVTIELTEKGLKADKGLASVQLLFEYLAMLRREGPQDWYYQELADIGNMKAKFKEEEDAMEYVSGVASNLLYVKPEHALIVEDLFQDWDPQLVESLLDDMTPGNCRIDLQTSAYGEAKANILDLPNSLESEEPWFEIPYISASIPEQNLESWKNAKQNIHCELKLPLRNDFVPTDFALECERDEISDKSNGHPGPAKRQKQETTAGVKEEKVLEGTVIESDLGPSEIAPSLILDEPGLRLWHALDTVFRTPRAAVYLILWTPKSYESPKASALTNLALRLIHDCLTETTYSAEISGLAYNVWPEARLGVELKFSGFNHKLPLLASTVTRALTTLSASDDMFQRVKEAQILKYKNANLNVHQHATYLRLRCLKQMWEYEDVLNELKLLKLSDIQAWIPQLWENLHLEAMIEGNMSVNTSEELSKSILSSLKSQKLQAQERSIDQVAHIPPNSSFLLRENAKNPAEENSAVEVYFQCGLNDTKLRASLDLLEQILSEPCFNVLRTKEQLGYSVHCGIRLTHNVLAFAFNIVSGSHAPGYLDSRVEAFLNSYLPELENMSEGEFDEHREALIDAKLQKDHNLEEQADRHWDAVLNRRYDFQSRLEEVEILSKITKETIVKAFKDFLLPGSTKRAKLAVHITCQKHKEEEKNIVSEKSKDFVALEKPEDLRESLKMYPPQESRLP